MFGPPFKLHLDPRSETPLWIQVVHEFQSALILNRFSEGHIVPGTRTFARNHGISRATTKRAYQTMVKLGWFEPRRGVGMSVHRRDRIEEIMIAHNELDRRLDILIDYANRAGLKPRSIRIKLRAYSDDEGQKLEHQVFD